MRPPPSRSEKTTMITAPIAAAAQNAADGRSRSSSAPSIAVASGRMPITTAPCEAGTVCIAKPLNAGNPPTSNSEASAMRGTFARGGSGRRSTARTTSASIPATAARPAVRNSGSRYGTAMRVIGRVAPKITTPTTPSSNPRVSRERMGDPGRGRRDRSGRLAAGKMRRRGGFDQAKGVMARIAFADVRGRRGEAQDDREGLPDDQAHRPSLDRQHGRPPACRPKPPDWFSPDVPHLEPDHPPPPPPLQRGDGGSRHFLHRHAAWFETPAARAPHHEGCGGLDGDVVGAGTGREQRRAGPVAP